MKVSLIQINSGEDKEINFSKSLHFLQQALKDKPDIICLPEYFLYPGEDVKPEKLNSDKIIKFQEFAKVNKVNLILGSIAITEHSSSKPTNSSLVINRKGKIIHRYDKMYMYTVETSEFTFRESETIAPGRSLGFFELEGVKMGIGICHDSKFPEYFRELVKKGVEIIFLPAEYLMKTGRLAHDILIRARAIENQAYFCFCDQTGGSGVKARCGDTRIVSFDGRIIKNLASGEGIISAELDLKSLRKFRKENPVLKQIRSL